MSPHYSDYRVVNKMANSRRWKHRSFPVVLFVLLSCFITLRSHQPPAGVELRQDVDELDHATKGKWQKISEFILLCLGKGENWHGYSNTHHERLVSTLIETEVFIHPMAHILHVGDGQGYLPVILHRFFGVVNQTSLDIEPLVARYACLQGTDWKHSDSSDCEYDASLLDADSNFIERKWDFQISSKFEDITNFKEWESIAASSVDIIFALEVVEHLETGPMPFLANSHRVLKNDGKIIISTPNSNSWTTLERVLTQQNPFSYSPFRRRGDFAGAEHIKEYSVHELHTAIQKGGFDLFVAKTFSPYHHKDPGSDARSFLMAKYNLNTDLLGEVHYCLGQKNLTKQRHKAFQPLYDFDEIL